MVSVVGHFIIFTYRKQINSLKKIKQKKNNRQRANS